MDSKIADYHALEPASFVRLERLEVGPASGDEDDTESMELRMELSRANDDVRLRLRFRGVHDLRLDDLRVHRPDFLDIEDMADRGWERSSRHAVSDCCQGPIAFHCADFEAETGS